MKRNLSNSPQMDFSSLRQQAEKKLLSEKQETEIEVSSIEEARRLITELKVYQIELELQNDELRRAQEQLALERGKYADLYNFAPVSYFTFDERDIIMDLNLSAAELLGNERKYLIGHPIAPYLTPHSFQKFISHRQAALETRLPQVCDLTIRHRNSGESYVHVRTVALDTSHGTPQLWRTVMTDITERKQQEERNKYLAYLLDSVSDAIIATDNELSITQWNKGAERLYGWRESEVLGKPIDQVCRTEFMVDNQLQARVQLLTRKFWKGELCQKKRDGTELWVTASVSQLNDEQGVPIGGVTINHDITERKAAEKELREKTNILNAIFESSPFIMMVVDAEGRVQNINHAGSTFAGRDKGELIGLLGGEVFNCLNSFNGLGCGRHSDCGNCPVRTRVMYTLRTGENIRNVEGHLTVLKDGKPFDIYMILSTTMVKVGEEKQVLVYIADITERKRIENELQINEERFRSLVSSLSDVIYTLDTNQRHTGVFGDWFQKAGLTAEYFWGKTARDLFGAEKAAIHEAANERALRGESTTYEWSMFEQSETVHYQTVVSPMRSSDGKIIGVVGVGRNITERKKIEDNLRRANIALQEQVQEIELLHEKLREQAVRDPLTGLFNRRYLQETLEREVARAQRESKPIGFIIMDLDHFKQVNDMYGHKAGDMALQKLGGLIIRNLRTGDISCRYGGEEFTLMMPGASLEKTLERASLLLRQIKDMDVEYNGAKIKVTASMGVSVFPEHGSNGEEALIHADNALYAAKALGRNQVVVYEGQ